MTPVKQIDTTIDIVTPENIAFHYQLAGPFRRLPAFLIDIAIMAVFIFALFLLVSFLATLGLLTGLVPLADLGGGLFLIGLFVVTWFYGGLFETYMNGQTPGKFLMGLRTLSVDGHPIDGMQAVVRNVLRTVDIWPQIFFIPTGLVGLVVMTFSGRFQRLGDLVCGTIVVVEKRSWLQGVASLDDPRAGQLAAYLPADLKVTPSFARTLATYIERRPYFSPARRREISRYLGQPLLERFGLRPDTSYDLLLCAVYYRVFIADRAQQELPVRSGTFSETKGSSSLTLTAAERDAQPAGHPAVQQAPAASPATTPFVS